MLNDRCGTDQNEEGKRGRLRRSANWDRRSIGCEPIPVLLALVPEEEKYSLEISPMGFHPSNDLDALANGEAGTESF